LQAVGRQSVASCRAISIPYFQKRADAVKVPDDLCGEAYAAKCVYPICGIAAISR